MPHPRVLVVDDEPVVRQRLTDALEDEGIEVAGQAGNGEDALVQLVGFRPDVVLMDLRMPGMGGVEAVSRIRELDPEVRVIVVSAYDDEALQAQARASGADGYFVKGWPLDLLLSLIGGARA